MLSVFYIIFTVQILSAQVGSVNELIDIPDVDVEIYRPKKDTPYVFVPSGFAASEVKNTKTPDSLKNHVVYKVVLVYSAYHKSENFNQEKLNYDRWNKLFLKNPELFSNGGTSYLNIRQTSATTDTSAKKLMHGFYIYYRQPALAEARKKEVDDLKEFMTTIGVDLKDSIESPSLVTLAKKAKLKPDDDEETTSLAERKETFWSPKRTRDKFACRQPFYGNGPSDIEDFFNSTVKLSKRLKKKRKPVDTDIILRLHFNGSLVSARIISSNKEFAPEISTAVKKMKRWNPSIKNGMTVKSDVRFKLRYSDGKFNLMGAPLVARQLQKCDCCTPDSLLFAEMDPTTLTMSEMADFLPVFSPEDSIIKKVSDRNPDMRDLLVAVDLTGSMSPYIMQVISLMEELTITRSPEVKCFSLFNDGDDKEDRKKEIGNTGGIYIVHGDITLKKLGRTILQAMQKGSGGDTPENNIEAVLKGLKACPECKDVVMVADNFATPRDGKLLPEINIPIHWIICGGEEGLNSEYLDLVRQNKGYLHTLNYDVKDLHLAKEGNVIKVGEQEFILKNGKFRKKLQST